MLHVPLSLLRVPTKNLRRDAREILHSVKVSLSRHGASTVTVVGHSLGAALSLLDGVYLRIHLDASVNVRVIAMACPASGIRTSPTGSTATSADT